MGKTAFIFPGQGAQYIGMGKDFYDKYEDSKDIYDKAAQILGIDMAKLCFAENDKINITEFTQIAMVTTCMAILEQVKKYSIKPDICAGLSLGEYPALMASGVLSFEEGIRVVRQRGILMQEAVEPGAGAMAAVLGMDTAIIEKVCETTEGIVIIANYNCPGQVVISGEKKAVESAGEELMKNGAKRVIPLNVSGPFHSPMLKAAGEKLYEVLGEAEIKDPVVPYAANVNAELIHKNDDIRTLLAKQVYSSVKWQQSVEAMITAGVDTFIEIGPGKTLSAFVKKIDKSCKVINIEKVEDLDKLQEV
ncbi:ACP S-malonyltransferase [Anaerocolumna sedimenticola]|uniref:Malonyl CoA-acyl carrier protein transacylase n=1 Tax=Anaerocolumna sedimenticola TaxID=2696063 RepID=A0A6P1TE56_9FIRM|nr:ACP S-malonyltransferase [Anaerocolumna sedimenticola]QHQ59520.1 ACP S-malonyltransferase [Anaerocolumna sedimenticola]